jgi:hypothetical protein
MWGTAESPSEQRRIEGVLAYGRIKSMRPRTDRPGEFRAKIEPPPDHLTDDQLAVFEKVWPVLSKHSREYAALDFQRACELDGVGMPELVDVLAEIDLRR